MILDRSPDACGRISEAALPLAPTFVQEVEGA